MKLRGPDKARDRCPASRWRRRPALGGRAPKGGRESRYTRTVVTTAKSLYSVHPSVLMTQKWVATLKEKTGRPLDEWLCLMDKSAPIDKKARIDWLKTEHAMGTNTAAWMAGLAEGKTDFVAGPDAYLIDAERYVEQMFSGGKAGLRPIYDALLKLGLGLGRDAKACPCRTMVPLYRKHVFAQIKPTTRTRIDLGFALGARPASGRLIDTGGYAKKDRITHRIPISAQTEIDAEVKQWLRTAFEEDR